MVLSNPLAKTGPLLFIKQVPGTFSHQLTAASGIGPPDPKAGRRPPLSRTSAMNASGSSSYGFAPKAVHHFP
jgi:hypothetical protein